MFQTLQNTTNNDMALIGFFKVLYAESSTKRQFKVLVGHHLKELLQNRPMEGPFHHH
jgi:hypothetical protein